MGEFLTGRRAGASTVLWRETVVLVEEGHAEQLGMIEPSGIVPASLRAELGGEISMEGEVNKYTGWFKHTACISSSLWHKTRNFSFFHNGQHSGEFLQFLHDQWYFNLYEVTVLKRLKIGSNKL